jgi:RimJ/RimL family protein N-acetyltransferase
MATTRTLKTDRLLLRPVADEDLVPIARLANNRRIARYLSRVPWPYTPDDARTFLDHTRTLGDDGAIYAITAPGQGMIGITGYEQAGGRGTAEIGYWLVEACWGKGYTTEAVAAVIEDAFTIGGAQRLVSRCIIENHASRAVLEKSSFRFTGIGSCAVASRGCAFASQEYELTRAEWVRRTGSAGR